MGAWRPKHVEWLCRNKTCTVLHQVGVSFDLYYDARKHKIKIHRVPLRRRGQLWSSGVRNSGMFWNDNTGLFEIIVWVLTTCHAQYTWDRRICVFFLFNRTTLQAFITYLTGALYMFDRLSLRLVCPLPQHCPVLHIQGYSKLLSGF